MTTVVLLILSNVFMTFAWYGHLRFKGVALWKVIAVSWLIAGVERPVLELKKGAACLLALPERIARLTSASVSARHSQPCPNWMNGPRTACTAVSSPRAARRGGAPPSAFATWRRKTATRRKPIK